MGAHERPDLVRLLGPKLLLGFIGAVVSLVSVVLLALYHYPDGDASCAEREPLAPQLVHGASSDKSLRQCKKTGEKK